MNFFVTGRSSRVAEVEDAIKEIEGRGHKVTFNWPPLPMVKPYEEHPAEAGKFALDAIKGIVSADVYVLLAHGDGNGVFTELGAALAIQEAKNNLKIFAVAKEIPSAMFHYHPGIVWKKSLTEIFADLGI